MKLIILICLFFCLTLYASTHKVETGDSLTLIAVELYGDSRRWVDLAQWNSLEPPYRIFVKQELILQKPPLLTPEEGGRLVLHYWRGRFGLLEDEYEQEAGSISQPQEVRTRKRVKKAAALLKSQKMEVAMDTLSALKRETEESSRSRAVGGEIAWVEGPEAAMIYNMMSEVETTPGKLDFNKLPPKKISAEDCERKVGATFICVRFPVLENGKYKRTSSGEVETLVKCAGT